MQFLILKQIIKKLYQLINAPFWNSSAKSAIESSKMPSFFFFLRLLGSTDNAQAWLLQGGRRGAARYGARRTARELITKKKQVGQEDSMLCCVKLMWATILYIIHYTMWPCHCINNQIICRLSFKKNYIFNSWWRLYCSTLLILVAISDGGTKKLICINKC